MEGKEGKRKGTSGIRPLKIRRGEKKKNSIRADAIL